MPFLVGETALVIALNKKGRVVEVKPRGRYKITLGSLQIECKEDELAATTPLPPETASASAVSPSLPKDIVRKKGTLRRLDLHGLRVMEAMARVETHLDRAILAGLDEVSIIHGFGSGKVTEALHELLSTLSVVKRFKLEEGNPGVTRVFL